RHRHPAVPTATCPGADRIRRAPRARAWRAEATAAMATPAPADPGNGPDTVANGDSAVDHPRIEAAVREILAAIGEDPDRDGLRETPARVARAYAEAFAGMRQDPAEVLRTVFEI